MNQFSFTRRISRSDFTPQQLEVLRLISWGLSTKEIASQMNLAYKTVDGYRQRVMLKCGVRNVVHATHCAIRLGLINWEELAGWTR